MTAEDASGPEDDEISSDANGAASEADEAPPDDPEGAGPECPFCGSTDTEIEAAFGSEVSKTQYYCNGCATVFERIKFDGDLPDTGR